MSTVPLILAPHFYYSLIGHLWLVLAVSFYSIGAMLVSAGFSTVPSSGFSFVLSRGVMRQCYTLVLLCSAVGSLLVVDVGSQYVNSWSEVSDVSGLAAIGVLSASDRYAGDFGFSAVQALLLAVNYSGCILAGFLLATRSKANVLILITPILSLIVFSLITNGKGAVLYGILLMISGWMAAKYCFCKMTAIPVNFKAIRLFGVSIVALCGFMYWIQWIRYGDSLILYDFFAVYGLGYLGGFFYWMDFYYSMEQAPHMGTASFGWLTSVLGIAEYRPETLEYKWLTPSLETNVNTIFAKVILDYGHFGGLIIFFLVGLMFEMLATIARRSGSIFAPLITLVYAVILWSWITSLFNYLTIIIAVVLCAVILFLIRWRPSYCPQHSNVVKK